MLYVLHALSAQAGHNTDPVDVMGWSMLSAVLATLAQLVKSNQAAVGPLQGPVSIVLQGHFPMQVMQHVLHAHQAPHTI
jgi:hypothetical protein